MGKPTPTIAHFIPHNVLRELQLLALKLQRDEIVRVHVLWRMWMVIPLTFVFLAVAGVCVSGVDKFMDAVLPSPAPAWLVLSTGVLLLPVVFLGAATTQFYVLISWLERGAIRKHLPVEGGSLERDIHDRSDRTRRIRSSCILVAVFVAVPLLMFFAASPSLARAAGGFALVSMLVSMIVTGDRAAAEHFMDPRPALFDRAMAWLPALFGSTMAWLVASFVGGALVFGISAAVIAAYWLEPTLPPDIIAGPYSAPSFVVFLSVVQLLLFCLVATVVLWVACFLLRKHLVSSASAIALCSLWGATYALALGPVQEALRDMEDAGVAEWLRWTYAIGFPAAALASLAAAAHRAGRDAPNPGK